MAGHNTKIEIQTNKTGQRRLVVRVATVQFNGEQVEAWPRNDFRLTELRSKVAPHVYATAWSDVTAKNAKRHEDEVWKVLYEVELSLQKQQAATGFSWECTVVLNFGTEQQKSAASTRLLRQREADGQTSVRNAVLAGVAIPTAGYLLFKLTGVLRRGLGE